MDYKIILQFIYKKNKTSFGTATMILLLTILFSSCRNIGHTGLSENKVNDVNSQVNTNTKNGLSINELIENLGIAEYIKKGYRGKDVTIAVLDSGVYSHVDYSDRVIKFKDFINDKKEMYDDFGHGSQVAGIIAGNGKASNGNYLGIAPDSKLVVVKVLDSIGQVNMRNFSKGLQWVIDNKDTYNIKAACISFGFTSKDNSGYTEIQHLIKEAKDAGILVIASAGNFGKGQNNISFPASLKDVISVGSLKIQNGEKSISDFSSREDLTCPDKPDIYAIGEDIITTNNRAISSQNVISNYYCTVTGTSFSAAIVVGEAALLIEANPNYNIIELTAVLNKINKIQ